VWHRSFQAVRWHLLAEVLKWVRSWVVFIFSKNFQHNEATFNWQELRAALHHNTEHQSPTENMLAEQVCTLLEATDLAIISHYHKYCVYNQWNLSWSCSAVVVFWFLGLRWGWALGVLGWNWTVPDTTPVPRLLSLWHAYRSCRSNQSSPDCSHVIVRSSPLSTLCVLAPLCAYPRPPCLGSLPSAEVPFSPSCSGHDFDDQAGADCSVSISRSEPPQDKHSWQAFLKHPTDLEEISNLFPLPAVFPFWL